MMVIEGNYKAWNFSDEMDKYSYYDFHCDINNIFLTYSELIDPYFIMKN